MQNTDGAAGDGRQLQEFVTELTGNQGRIRAFIVTLMPGSTDVGDVLQETNLVLWKSRDRFRPGSNFLAWAFTIARLEVLHQRTRDKRQRRMLLSDELLDLLAEEIPMRSRRRRPASLSKPASSKSSISKPASGTDLARKKMHFHSFPLALTKNTGIFGGGAPNQLPFGSSENRREFQKKL